MDGKSIASKWRWITAVVIAFALGIGVTLLVGKRSRRKSDLERTFDIIEQNYVDKVDRSELEESLIPQLLNTLDPHSTYLTREESDIDMQRLEGAFYGVGISFNTIIDTPVVVEVIPGGPAERAGMKKGDRIIAADAENLLTKDLTSEGVRKRLLGKKGSVVALSVLRDGKKMEIPVTRDEVPIQSIDVAYIAEKGIGLMRIGSWSRGTYGEFIAKASRLMNVGM